MDAPAGNHFGLGAEAACPAGIDGKLKWPNSGPGRLDRERATAKTISSLIDVVFANFFSKGLFEPCALKDYPLEMFALHLKHHEDIHGLLELAPCLYLLNYRYRRGSR
jgi:hypothetical protein